MLCDGGGEAGDYAGFTAVQHLLRNQLAAVMDREATEHLQSLMPVGKAMVSS